MDESNLADVYHSVKDKLHGDLRDYVALRVLDPEGWDLEERTKFSVRTDKTSHLALLKELQARELQIHQNIYSSRDVSTLIEGNYEDALGLAQLDYVKRLEKERTIVPMQHAAPGERGIRETI